MVARVSYTCDGPCCGKKMSVPGQGPIHVSLHSDHEPQANALLHVCSVACLHDWIYYNGGKPQGDRVPPGAVQGHVVHVEERRRA